MRKIFVLVSVFLKTNLIVAQTIGLVAFKDVKEIYSRKNDTTYIVNFFASWCVPCIQELPELLLFTQNRKDKVRLILVSLDFPDSYLKDLTHTIKKCNINEQVFVIKDPDANTWVSEVDTNWSGAIPATLLLNHDKGTSKFIEGKINIIQMQEWIK